MSQQFPPEVVDSQPPLPSNLHTVDPFAVSESEFILSPPPNHLTSEFILTSPNPHPHLQSDASHLFQQEHSNYGEGSMDEGMWNRKKN